MAGYSGTPLAKKLGIKPGWQVCVLNAPENYLDLLTPLSEGCIISAGFSDAARMIHLFAASRAALGSELPNLKARIAPDCAIWVSWPKRASGVPTDVTEDAILEVALPLGLVDAKVCAVDDVW